MTTKIGTNVVDLNVFHIFFNFLISDFGLRDCSLLRSRNESNSLSTKPAYWQVQPFATFVAFLLKAFLRE